jgi:hypothetical protein
MPYYEDWSSAQTTPAQNLRRGSGTSPPALCKYHLLSATSKMWMSDISAFFWASISSCASLDKRRQLTATSVPFSYGKVTPPKYTSSPCFDAGMVTITPSARPMVSGPLLFVQKLLIMSYLIKALVANGGPDQPRVV